MEILLSIFYAFCFILLIRKMHFFRNCAIHPNLLTGIFILKIVAGILVWIIYTYYYTDRCQADIYKYFDDSKVMVHALFSKPLDFFRMLFGIDCGGTYFKEHYFDVMQHWYRPQESNMFNDNHTIIRFNALAHLFSFGYFNVHTVIMCFLSFTGLTALFKALAPFYPGKKNALIALIYLIPSVLFWSSGVLKESLLIFALGLLIRKCLIISAKQYKWTDILVLVFCILLLLILKVYILACLLPSLFTWYWVEKSSRKLILLKYLAIYAVYFAAALNLQHVSSDHNILETIVKKQKWFLGLARNSQSGSAFQMDVLNPTPSSFLKAAPEALMNSIARPFIWSKGNALSRMAALENSAIIVFILLCISKSKRMGAAERNLFIMLISYVLMLYLLIGWVTPVAGAIARYRVPGIPMLLAAFLLLVDENKINKLWTKTRSSQVPLPA